MTQELTEAYEVVTILNNDLYERIMDVYGEVELDNFELFSVTGNEVYACITFGEKTMWCSEAEDRPAIDPPPLIDWVRLQFNTYVQKLSNIKL